MSTSMELRPYVPSIDQTLKPSELHKVVSPSVRKGAITWEEIATLTTGFDDTSIAFFFDQKEEITESGKTYPEQWWLGGINYCAAHPNAAALTAPFQACLRCGNIQIEGRGERVLRLKAYAQS